MALALITRNCSKIQSLNLVRATNALSVSKLSNGLGSISATLQRSVLLSQPSQVRLISLSQPRLSSHGDHSKLWPIEKAVTLGLLVLFPAAIAVPNPVLDNLLALAVVPHIHWGLEACVVDYVRPIIFGPLIPKLTIGLLYAVSIVTLGGLIYYNINDVGIGRTVRKIWAKKPKE